MATTTINHPLVAIVGQTASGKSALALELARRFSGEIIAADSRTIYKGMDIGTAKPSIADRRLVPHHLIDILEPDQSFSAAQFQKLAYECISDISSRGNLPLLVGGTGLYVDAVIYHYSFRGSANMALRQRLNDLSVSELQDILFKQGLPLPNNPQNPRYLARSIETAGAPEARDHINSNTLVIGMDIEREALRQRVEQRVDTMLNSGLEQEVQRLTEQYGWNCLALQSIGYQEFRSYFENGVSLKEVRNEIIRNTMRYAKRQKTWFKRNKSISWISNTEDAAVLITTLLNK
ncbi:MAG TPA: tRNA (adenosine(37)-N6)-dimethylallyltransferase MiaA [Patescibacteria group bacterium]|nr:tRNA (adenosine(37)-N6)-dimethylallyltransferase MiaA [Patescibacteria group bacterium]